MRAVVQRVKDASVTVDGSVTGSITQGLLVYLGVAADDSEKDADWMAEKVAHIRIFEDAQGKMNLSIKDILAAVGVNSANESSVGTNSVGASSAGVCSVGVLTVSQFTLLADARKGRRPYYGDAAEPEKANALYEYFRAKISEQGLKSEAGIFQAHMDVRYTNDGPVTIILDSR